MITNITPVDCETTNRVQYEGFPYRASLVFGTALNRFFFLTFQVTLKPKLCHALEMIKKKKSTFNLHTKMRKQKANMASHVCNFYLPILHWNAYIYRCCTLLRWTHKKHLSFQGTTQFHP